MENETISNLTKTNSETSKGVVNSMTQANASLLPFEKFAELARPQISSVSGKKLVIYIPAYNCKNVVGSVLRRLPQIPNATAVVLDNASTDGTSEAVRLEIETGTLPLPTLVIRSEENLGYAGSQKAAYTLLRDLPSVEWVLMVHGDGQYEPALVSRMLPVMQSDADLAYGVRSKREPNEETPWKTYLVIKILSLIESLITGHFRKEWHSGFVMYRTRFLKRVNLRALTSTPHIDGNLLFVAGLIKAKIQPVTIYKRYKELTAFEGAERRKYVMNVFKLMWSFRKMRPEDILRQTQN